MSTDFLTTISRCITEADSNGLLLESREVSGFSGSKLVGLLQRLAGMRNASTECYLEVGVFQGLTLISTANAARNLPVFGVDNFAQFDPAKKNLEIVRKRTIANDLSNVTLINNDYEDALESLHAHIAERKIGVYFVDGPHDYRSQYMCLALAKPYLSDDVVIVVDDANYRHVRQANRDFLVTHPEYKLIFEAYTPSHPSNMDKNGEDAARTGWWNGVNVIVRDSENILEPAYPETVRSRQLYENEHIVHALKYANCAPEATVMVAAFADFKPRMALRHFSKVIQKVRAAKAGEKADYQFMNTWSSQLPTYRLHPQLRQP
ncbi:MAG: class I SAM-dependent methyltransferase [Candidatus Hydrogenedentes bacterium]|nr:class I SAM-dependent methyltransferase [Candidatus Hydrogenedentota bacterium]